jgi:DNA-directed RNA polymerase subunit K/omega
VSPIESRFLFVNVAALRAKQLRRGALPRLASLRPDPQTGVRPASPHKLERVAMDEVEGGLIVYELPEPKATPSREAP